MTSEENNKEGLTEIGIPFSGFYESDHSAIIDNEVEQLFMDDRGDIVDMPDDFWFEYSAKDICLEYAREYVETLKGWLATEGIDLPSLTFSELISPREYNFTTDRIIATISKEDIIKLYSLAKPEVMEKIVKERHSHRSGFHSFYSADYLKDWFPKSVLTWDANELETLFLAAIESKEVDTTIDAWELMEGDRCNGVISSIVWDNLPPKCKEMANQWYEKHRAEIT